MMPPTLSITCKTAWVHVNTAVSRPEEDPKVRTGFSLFLIGLLWQRRRALAEGSEREGDIH